MLLNKIENLKVVFFDMGGTLLHFHKTLSNEVKDEIGLSYMLTYLKNKHHFSGDLQTLKNEYWPLFDELMKTRSQDTYEYPIEDHMNLFLRKYGIFLTQPEAHFCQKLFIKEYHPYIWTEDCTKDVLAIIKERGLKIGVISNTYLPDEIMIEFFETAGLHPFIDDYTFSYYQQIKKPRPEIFHYALEKMNCSAQNTLMIGDKLEADVLGAEQVGMSTIWYNLKNISNSTNILPQYTISSFIELIN